MSRDKQKRLERLEQSAAERATLENWPPDEFDEDGNLAVFYMPGVDGRPVRLTLDDLV